MRTHARVRWGLGPTTSRHVTTTAWRKRAGLRGASWRRLTWHGTLLCCTGSRGRCECARSAPQSIDCSECRAGIPPPFPPSWRPGRTIATRCVECCTPCTALGSSRPKRLSDQLALGFHAGGDQNPRKAGRGYWAVRAAYVGTHCNCAAQRVPSKKLLYNVGVKKTSGWWRSTACSSSFDVEIKSVDCLSRWKCRRLPCSSRHRRVSRSNVVLRFCPPHPHLGRGGPWEADSDLETQLGPRPACPAAGGTLPGHNAGHDAGLSAASAAGGQRAARAAVRRPHRRPSGGVGGRHPDAAETLGAAAAPEKARIGPSAHRSSASCAGSSYCG